jgi:hypothetical protein
MILVVAVKWLAPTLYIHTCNVGLVSWKLRSRGSILSTKLL